MHPVLFQIGNFPVRTFGVLLVVGVLVATYMAQRRATRHGIAAEKVWDAVIWLVLPGILGARIFYIVQHLDFFTKNPDQLLSLRFEGLTSFGGLAFGFIGLLLWTRREKVSMPVFLDIVGVPVLVAQAIGRVGCLMNGCCYGRPTTEWYGIHIHGLAERHVPAQFTDMVLMLAGAGIIAWVERHRRLVAGQSFSLMLVAYGLSRFFYEFFRAGTEEEFRMGIASSSYFMGSPITTAQLVSLLMVGIGFVVYVYFQRRQTGTVQTAGA
ncbi:MAG: prolipoprotein diacylglyceryl transferase [Fimbriimonadaceae bacterium]|nr:MAG: prolipoprotein diacylglyceryl transferase [Fimbriimonadaceae bacterium]